MNTKQNSSKGIIAFSIIFYIIGTALMVLGSIKDLQIDMTLYNPSNYPAHFAEMFSQLVCWGIWGPAFTIIFLCRRDLNGCLEVINKVFPFIKPFNDIKSKAYKVLNTILNIITTLGFFVLAVIGWKKLIENILKNALREAGRDNLSQLVYFIICAVFTVAMIFLFSKIDKRTLKKLEGLALAGVLLGIFFKIVEECKQITNRVRFREMIAYSNGFLDEDGMSDGQHAPLTKAMIKSTDFSAFTPWYRIGNDMGIYDRADSFPSGHTTSCCAIFLSYPFCLAFGKLKKLAPFAFIFSALYVIAIGFSRMVTGAHYLTDVVGAAMIAYALFLIVYKIYSDFTKKGIIG